LGPRQESWIAVPDENGAHYLAKWRNASVYECRSPLSGFGNGVCSNGLRFGFLESIGWKAAWRRLDGNDPERILLAHDFSSEFFALATVRADEEQQMASLYFVL
jgi:hypothetical protein